MNTTTTTRTITFSVVDPRTRQVTDIRRFPAGTEVTTRLRRNGQLEARVRGTLYKQTVSHDDVLAPI